MDKVKIKHLGKTEYRSSHGNVSVVFAPGEEKEVPFYVAQNLLREKAVKRRFKEDGSFLSQKTVELFEEVIAAEAAEETNTVSGEEQNPNGEENPGGEENQGDQE